MYPPTTGPRTGADIAVIDQIPRAVARFCAGKIAISNAWLPGTIGPDTAPCKMRNTISDGRLQAIPQRNDAIVNASTAAVKVRTTPKRPINQPVSGTVTPLATANDVITQVPLSVLTPRFPEIVASDTFSDGRVQNLHETTEGKRNSGHAQGHAGERCKLPAGVCLGVH